MNPEGRGAFNPEREQSVDDTPLASTAVDVVLHPITPAALQYLSGRGIGVYNPELLLVLFNRAEDLGRQLTKKEVEESADEFKEVLRQYNEQQEFAKSLSQGWTREKVVDVEILHEPNSPYRGKARIRIRAITEQGHKVTVRNVDRLDLRRISAKKDMARDFAATHLVGKSIDFCKLVAPGGKAGNRVYLRANLGWLPDFKDLDYARLTEWAEGKHKRTKSK